MDKVVLDPVESEHAIDLRRVLRQVFVFQLALGLPWSVPQEVPILSKSGLARLYSTTSQNGIWETVHTTIDEPLAFKAAINFIEEKDEEFYMLCWEQYRSSGFPPMGIEIFERHVPLDLVSAFHMQVFNQKAFSTPVPATSKTEHWILIPASEPVTFPLNLFDSPAEIVGWEDCRWGFEYKGTLTMRDFLEAHYKHDSRKGDEDVSPFFYPRLGSGPDIVFVVRVNEDLYPVFVKASLLQDLSPEDVEEYRLTLHESRIKEHLPELSEYCSRGKYFSLIYARCTISRTLQEDWSRDDLWDTAPATGPQVDRPLMQLLMVIDESNMRDIVPNGIVEMLNTMNGSKRMSDDPGSPDRSHKKFMWEKQ
ncbi:hypothetical protein BGZ73_004083 [Actinomortierella ambigua]|nr:hypothetical protein BGZ73_004083 [Actinomortierella ambigua]